jgi:hypothetical protein
MTTRLTPAEREQVMDVAQKVITILREVPQGRERRIRIEALRMELGLAQKARVKDVGAFGLGTDES